MFLCFQGTVVSDWPCDQSACPIHNIGAGNAGTYKCTVTNKINGQERSESRSLNVEVIGENL